MGSLIFVKRLSTSPYNEYSKQDSLAQIQHLITKDFCSQVGYASESALCTVVTIGASALQTIIKMTSILRVSISHLPNSKYIDYYDRTTFD